MASNDIGERASQRIEEEKGSNNIVNMLKTATYPVVGVASAIVGYMVSGSAEVMSKVAPAVPELAKVAAKLSVPVLGEFIFTKIDLLSVGGLVTVGLLGTALLFSVLDEARKNASDARLAAHLNDIRR